MTIVSFRVYLSTPLFMMYVITLTGAINEWLDGRANERYLKSRYVPVS